jgi:hypothetical protein
VSARRAPILAAFVVVVAGAVVASEAGDGTPTVRPIGEAPGVQVPALPPDDVLASTWYCAAGTARDGGMADHTVVVVNPGDTPVSGTLTVRTGEVARGERVDDPLTAEDESAPPEDDDADADAAAGDESDDADADAAAGDESDDADADAAAGDESDDADADAAAAAEDESASPEDADATADEAASADDGDEASDDAAAPAGDGGGSAEDPAAPGEASGDEAALAEGAEAGAGSSDDAPAADPTGADQPAAAGVGEGELAAAAGERRVAQEPDVGDPWEEEGGVDETPIEEAFELPAGGRASIRLADLVESPLAAALVEASAPVAVEHEVVGPDGRDAGPCASSAASEWHLAYGVTTRNAREVLVLFNPFASTATVDVTFATDDGRREPQRYQGLPIPAGGVIGLDVGEDVTRKGQVSTTVRARSGSLVVERLQSFDGSSGSRIRGLSVALASPEPLEAWGFATGIIGNGRREWVVLYNPGDERAEVDVSVRTAGESSPPPPYGLTVRAGGYEVLEYGEDDRVPAGKGHVTIVRSSNGVPIVAERVLSTPGAPGWREPDSEATGGDISATTGAAFADRRWVLGTLGRQDDEARDYLVAFNPDPEETAVLDVRGLVDGRLVEPPEHMDLEVPPGERLEVRLGGALGVAGAAILAEADLPLVVERVTASPDRVVQAVSPGIIGGDDPLPLADVDLGLGP